MASFVVGDIQGSYTALRKLLDKADFDPSSDSLWCVGDLINRGGESLQTLDFLHSIRDSTTIVLGNHDLHLLALYAGNNSKQATPELLKILNHSNASLWCDWLRRQQLVHYDQSRNCLLVHAGIPHIWTLQQTIDNARAVESQLAGDNFGRFLNRIYGNYPSKWCNNLYDLDRSRAIINYLTRMRFISADGRLDLTTTSGIGQSKHPYKPWFSFPRADRADTRIIFGHWAALQGDCAGKNTIAILATDTGYVWNGRLSLFDVDNWKICYSVSAKEKEYDL